MALTVARVVDEEKGMVRSRWSSELVLKVQKPLNRWKPIQRKSGVSSKENPHLGRFSVGPSSQQKCSLFTFFGIEIY